MMKKRKFELNSRMVSGLLIAVIVLLAIGIGVGSWFLQKTLSSKATETDHTKIDAELSQTELQRAKSLETYLDDNKAAVDKAQSVVAETQTYQYQNQIVNDIESYAEKAGVNILGYSFPLATSDAKPDSSGLKTVSATLTLKNPVSYIKYLKFLKYIEQNVTKMQITDVTLTPDKDNPKQIDSPTIGLKVYVR